MDDLYIPQDERDLRRVQRKAEELERRVAAWAQSVIQTLPKGLSLHDEELDVLVLFLAQQRRLNLEMDGRAPEDGIRIRLTRVLPLLGEAPDDGRVHRAVHRIVSRRLESEIDRACALFCDDFQIPPISDPAIDWRVAIRFMCQSLYNIVAQVDLRKIGNSPRRFQLAAVARELADSVVEKRRHMVSAFAPQV
jgi:hypothetical protein